MIYRANISFIASLLILISLSCNNEGKPNKDAELIYNQLPEQRRICLVPDDFIIPLEGENVIPFSMVEDRQNEISKVFSEHEFYNYARLQGVQYIIVSSDMIDNQNSNFPWIIDKNFKICPGDPDSDFEKYYVLLVWDSAKKSYHFFKYLYPDKET